MYSCLMSSTVYTPVAIRGEVVAGRPSNGEEVGLGYIGVDLASVGITQNARTFALKVRGDSMIGAHIMEGDIVILEQKPPHDGAIVAACVDGSCTFKRYFMRRGVPFLKAENPKYPDVHPVGELYIQGVMIGLFRKT
jgi:repressor LexA